MKEFKVGTFNLRNLVLPNHTFYEKDRYTQDEYDKKKDWTRSQLAKMAAEIVGFQEVFHKAALEDVLQGTPLAANVQVLGETGESPRVGLASSFPLACAPESIENIDAQIFSAFPGLAEDHTKFSRPVLKVKLALSDTLNVTVMVCHLKSKRPDIPDGADKKDFAVQAAGEARSLLKRAVEAAGLRKLILDELAGNNAPLILLGDFNDSTRSVTSNIIFGPSPWKYSRLEEKKKYWDVVLYDTFDIMAQRSFKKEWPTHIYNGHYEELDHICVSQEFYFRNAERMGDLEFVHVLDDHLQDSTLSSDKQPNWQSDHGQVVATIRMRSRS
jgi:predicted extracellular nuclease